jgi:hypothetical protein
MLGGNTARLGASVKTADDAEVATVAQVSIPVADCTWG